MLLSFLSLATKVFHLRQTYNKSQLEPEKINVYTNMYIKRMLFEVKSGQEEKAESVQSKWIIQISTYSI